MPRAASFPSTAAQTIIWSVDKYSAGLMTLPIQLACFYCLSAAPYSLQMLTMLDEGLQWLLLETEVVQAPARRTLHQFAADQFLSTSDPAPISEPAAAVFALATLPAPGLASLLLSASSFAVARVVSQQVLPISFVAFSQLNCMACFNCRSGFFTLICDCNLWFRSHVRQIPPNLPHALQTSSASGSAVAFGTSQPVCVLFRLPSVGAAELPAMVLSCAVRCVGSEW